MKFFLSITVLLIFFSGNVYSQSFPNPATLSTGQGAPGSLDPIWVVSPWYPGSPPNPIGLSYTPALINNNCAPGSWVDPASLPPPVNNGNWITSTGSPCTGSAGYLYFRLTIDLPADCNGNSVSTPGNYILYFSGYVDNGISDVFINGNSTGISGGGFSPGTQLNMTLTGPWVTGINYIDVLVYNGGGPYGLLLVANSSASSAANGDGDDVSDLYDVCPCQPGSLPNGCAASIVGDTIICKGESTTLTSTGLGNYLWNTGSTNASIIINPSVSASYYVLVTLTNGYKDSASVNIIVNPSPLISITGDTLLCRGESTSLTANGGGTYSWNTGSTNNMITENPASTTNYKVVVTNSFSCKDSVNQSVAVFPKPDADYTFTNQCNGTGIPFNSISTINNPDNITNWYWEFGDNTIGNSGTTSHLYNNPGNYNVSLTVISNNYCSDTIMHQVTVFNNPIVGFTRNDICLGDTMRFTNTSYVNTPDSISGYLWTFDDNSPSSNIESPSHYYSSAGSHNVILVATTANACSNALSIPVNVFDPPGTGFIFNNTCLSDSAVFTNYTLNPTMGNTANWSWDFGDGSSTNTTDWSPAHLYAVPGNYAISLITYSSNLGCPDTLQNTITVFPMPVADFDFTNVCLGQSLYFYDSSMVPNGSIIGWLWDFGDGTDQSFVQNPNHLFGNPGTYSITLTVTSNNSCNDTIIKSIVVHPLPVVQFSSTVVCDGNPVQFNDLSEILTTDTIQSGAWAFGDGNIVNTNQDISHLYNQAGAYTVQLMIVSNFGCVDSATKTSIVNPNPEISFTASDSAGCEPLCINFQDFSTINSGNILNRVWNLGDASIVNNSLNFEHCYINDAVYLPNSHTVSITVTSDSGCVNILSKNNYITVFPSPVASFAAQPETTTSADPVISIKDLSTGAYYWNWNFGDGSASISKGLDTSTVFSPGLHTYDDTSSYTITLITSTQYNCADTAYQTIVIEPEFLFYIPNAFTPDGDGINDSFGGKGIFIKALEMTIFDRWGNLVYKTDDINKPWDGKILKIGASAEVSLTDVFVYSVKITDFKNIKHNYKGLVTVVR